MMNDIFTSTWELSINISDRIPEDASADAATATEPGALWTTGLDGNAGTGRAPRSGEAPLFPFPL